MFQIRFPGDLHGRDDNKKRCEGFHLEQIHLFEKSLELARFRCDHERLRDDRYGSGQLGWFEDVSGLEGSQDSFHHAR